MIIFFPLKRHRNEISIRSLHLLARHSSEEIDFWHCGLWLNC
jgi:hypothetical protein